MLSRSESNCTAPSIGIVQVIFRIEFGCQKHHTGPDHIRRCDVVLAILLQDQALVFARALSLRQPFVIAVICEAAPFTAKLACKQIDLITHGVPLCE